MTQRQDNDHSAVYIMQLRCTLAHITGEMWTLSFIDTRADINIVLYCSLSRCELCVSQHGRWGGGVSPTCRVAGCRRLVCENYGLSRELLDSAVLFWTTGRALTALLSGAMLSRGWFLCNTVQRCLLKEYKSLLCQKDLPQNVMVPFLAHASCRPKQNLESL